MKGSVDNKSLSQRDINALLDKIDATPELPPEQKIIDSKKKVLEFLKDGIIKLFDKGYSHSAIADYLNSEQEVFKISVLEIRKVLSEGRRSKEKSAEPKKRAGRKPKEPMTHKKDAAIPLDSGSAQE